MTDTPNTPNTEQPPKPGFNARLHAAVDRLAKTHAARPAAGLALLLLILLAVNVVAGWIPLRFDMTQGNQYSLSEGSEAILEGMKEPVTVKLFYSKSLPDVPVPLKQFAGRVKELLKQYKSASGGKITLEFLDPKPDSEEEEWAKRYGLQGRRLAQGDAFYLGAVLSSGGRESAIPAFDPGRERFLEYDISDALSRVIHPAKKRIGVYGTLPGSQGGGFSFMGGAPQEWVIFQELRRAYQVEQLNAQMTEVPDGMALVVLVHPKGLPEKAQYALDQFVLRGGRVMVFLDPYARVEGGSGMPGGPQDRSSNLPTLLTAWGVMAQTNQIVADRNLATQVQTPQGPMPFPLWMSITGATLNHDAVITANLEQMVIIEGAALEKIPGSTTTFTPLLSTSDQSGTLEGFIAQFSPSPLDLIRSVQYDGKKRVMAALVTGRFSSAFPQGAPKEPKPAKPAKPGKPGETIAPPKAQPAHLAQAQQDSAVLVVGDADMLADMFTIQAVPMQGGQTVYRPRNDNLIFFLNAVEYLTGSQELIQIRSRGMASHPFTTLQSFLRRAQERYMEEEQSLRTELNDVQRRLQELQQQNQGNALTLTPEVMAEIQRIRDKEAQTKQALREVRKVLRQEIEWLDKALLAFNLLLVPSLVLGFGMWGYRRRTREGGR
ncbi:MAG: GldG family protein [Deltaproteobacteria bacterium]|nr:GldG family protein [Deltaproteobacteria bacterium]